MKGGIDATTKDLKSMSATRKKEIKLSVEKLIIFQSIKQMFVNLAIAKQLMLFDLASI